MNKKTYINPELDIYKIEAVQLLDASKTGKGGDFDPLTDPIEAPGFVDIDELDIFKNM